MEIYNWTIQPWLGGQVAVAIVLIAGYWLWYRFK